MGRELLPRMHARTHRLGRYRNVLQGRLSGKKEKTPLSLVVTSPKPNEGISLSSSNGCHDTNQRASDEHIAKRRQFISWRWQVWWTYLECATDNGDRTLVRIQLARRCTGANHGVS